MTPDAKLQIFAIKRGSITKNFSVKYAMFAFKYGNILASHCILKDFLAKPLSNGIFVPPKLFGAGTKLVNVFDLYQGPFVQEESLEEVQINSDDQQKYLAIKGDVLFCRSSIKPEGVGWTSYIKYAKTRLVYECHIIRARLTKDLIPAFLSHFAQTKLCREYILANASITTMATIPQEVVENIPLICPPVEIQLKLVEMLEYACQRKTQKLQQAEDLLAGMDEFVLDMLGIKPCSEAKKLCFAIKRKALDGVIDVKRHLGGMQLGNFKVQDIANIADQKINPQNFPDDIFDWIRIDDLPNHPLDITEIRTESGKNIEGTFFEVFPGDILVARLGPTILNRKTIMVRTTQRRTIASAEFLVLRCKEGFSPESVMAVIKTKFFVEQMYAHARGSTPSRYRLNREDMLSLPFPDISTVQEQIRTEALYRQKTVAKLRQDAEKEWQSAREQFEKELLGE